MEINYKEMEQKIKEDISELKNRLDTLYETINEAEEYSYEVAFGANSTEESVKSAFNSGRAIGEIEGQIDQLNTLLNFYYTQEQNKEE